MFPAFPAHAHTAILRIWQEAHERNSINPVIILPALTYIHTIYKWRHFMLVQNSIAFWDDSLYIVWPVGKDLPKNV